MGEPLIDFAIVTAIEIEREAVCRAFGMDATDRVHKGTRTYWRKQLALSPNDFYEIVVTQLPDVANVDAALVVQHTIDDWEPEAVLMVGVAGAARESVQPGDVVLGLEVAYYGRGKETSAGLLPEPKQYPTDETLRDRVTSLAAWEASIPVQRPDETDTRPRVHQGVIASGERVIANADIRSEIAANNRKILAIDMEGYGVSAAAWKQFKPIRCLVIRAVSDRADAQKDDRWQPYAAAVAAEFTKHFLLDRPLEPRNPPRYPPPPRSQYKPIVDNLKTGSIVPFLGPGICPELYIQLAAKLAESVAQELRNDSGQNDSSKGDLLQSLIGIPCQICHYLPDERPKECPMLKGLERAKTCPLYIEQGLAVSKMNLRYLSQYYKLTDNLDAFYIRLHEIVDGIDSHQPNPVHQFFAELPHQMLAKGYPKRCPGLPYQLIVTTNYDSLLEQAFDEANQPYDVVFYVADGEERGRYKHKPYGAEAEVIKNPEKYDKFPVRSQDGKGPEPHPIILKLYGTWENNFVVAEDHLNYLASTPIKNLPAALISILKKSSVLFLGYSPNDSDLQLILHRLWQEDKLSPKSLLVHQSQPGNLETRIWEERKVKLLPICCPLKDFVSSLEQDLEAS